jgi:hypothetical protein
VEEIDRSNMALVTGRGAAGMIGRWGAQALLSWGAIGLAAAALVVCTVVTYDNGGLSPASTPGGAGVQGPPGAGTSWGTLNLTFQLGGKASNLSVAWAHCALQGHGAYACEVAVSSSSTTAQKVTGLSYPENPALYYAGADPTIGSIVLAPQATSTFTLWFQATQTNGSTAVEVTLLVASAASS